MDLVDLQQPQLRSIEECQRVGQEAKSCAQKEGATSENCIRLSSDYATCIVKRSSLLSPARSEKVAKCYNANKTNPLACEDAIVEWVNDTKRIFEEIGKTDQGKELEVIGSACAKPIATFKSCFADTESFHKCYKESTELDACAIGFACPKELQKFNECLKNENGNESKCMRQLDRYAACTFDTEQHIYERYANMRISRFGA